MEAVIADLRPDLATPFPVVVARLLGAALLAGLIGLEREVRAHEAGLRTNMLVGVAAAAFALVAEEILAQTVLAGGGPGSGAGGGASGYGIDPLRLVEAVTSGVAFLAAGMIVFHRGAVRGLTTGASMWLSAAVGLSAGLGLWEIAALAAGLGVLVLVGVRGIEHAAGLRRRRRGRGEDGRGEA